jgi:hypothetical protein
MILSADWFALKSIKTKRTMELILTIAAGLATIALLPAFTGTLASLEAKADIKNSPYVTLTTNSYLPEQLQSQNNSNQSAMVQLLTINNGTTYLYLLNTSNQNLLNTSNQSKKYWEIITVPNSEIRSITYYDPKLREAKPEATP